MTYLEQMQKSALTALEAAEEIDIAAHSKNSVQLLMAARVFLHAIEIYVERIGGNDKH